MTGTTRGGIPSPLPGKNHLQGDPGRFFRRTGRSEKTPGPNAPNDVLVS